MATDQMQLTLHSIAILLSLASVASPVMAQVNDLSKEDRVLMEAMYDAISTADGNEKTTTPVSTAHDYSGHLTPYLPLHEVDASTAALAIYFNSSLASGRDQLIENLIKFGLTEETALAIYELVDEAYRQKQALYRQTDQLESAKLVTSVEDRKRLVRINQEQNKKIEAALTEKLFDLLSEDEESKLVGFLYAGYSFPEGLLNLFSIRKLGLSNSQVERFKSIQAEYEQMVLKSNRADIAKGVEPTAIWNKKELKPAFLRHIARSMATLTPNQFRMCLTHSGQMQPGERWSQWFARQEADFQPVLKANYPELMAEIAKESESGVLVTP